MLVSSKPRSLQAQARPGEVTCLWAAASGIASCKTARCAAALKFRHGRIGFLLPLSYAMMQPVKLC